MDRQLSYDAAAAEIEALLGEEPQLDDAEYHEPARRPSMESHGMPLAFPFAAADAHGREGRLP